MSQTNLFTDIKCDHCNQELAPSAKNPAMANGFYDQDTKEYVCLPCKAIHYFKKNKAGMQGLYSEMPVLL